MVNFSSSGNNPIQWEGDDQPQIVLAQLSQATSTMRHIDEVFLWLVHMIVNRFDVQVAQVWTMQATTTGQMSPQLRSVTCRDHSLPQNLVVNTYTADLVGHILDEQRAAYPEYVDANFSSYHALLLKRYGLHYSAGAFFATDMLVPPPRGRTSTSMQKVPTPLAMVLLLFFRHMPHQDLLPAIGSILTQALPVASSRGFLLPAYAYESPALPSHLIAHRVEDPMDNPISATMALPEEQMRHIYKVIDGRRSVVQLSRLTNIELKNVVVILQKLVVMRRVQMCEPTGRCVEDVRFLKEF